MLKIFIILSVVVLCKASSSKLQCGVKAITAMKKYYVTSSSSCYLPSGSSSLEDTKLPERRYKVVNGPVLLFRIVSGSGVSAYGLYSSNTGFNKSLSDQEGYKNLNYKSSLFEEWTHLRPLFINVTLQDSSNVTVAWLNFQVALNDDIFSWFNLSSLVSCYPWTIGLIKSRSYDYFSIVGYQGFAMKRTFSINWFTDIKCVDNGVMSIYEISDACPYSRGPSYPMILYMNNNGDGGDIATYKKQAQYMELLAVYSQDTQILN